MATPKKKQPSTAEVNRTDPHAEKLKKKSNEGKHVLLDKVSHRNYDEDLVDEEQQTGSFLQGRLFSQCKKRNTRAITVLDGNKHSYMNEPGSIEDDTNCKNECTTDTIDKPLSPKSDQDQESESYGGSFLVSSGESSSGSSHFSTSESLGHSCSASSGDQCSSSSIGHDVVAKSRDKLCFIISEEFGLDFEEVKNAFDQHHEWSGEKKEIVKKLMTTCNCSINRDQVIGFFRFPNVTKKCGRPRCKQCDSFVEHDYSGKEVFMGEDDVTFNCTQEDCVYLIYNDNEECSDLYVGQSDNSVHIRLSGHKSTMKKNPDHPIAKMLRKGKQKVWALMQLDVRRAMTELHMDKLTRKEQKQVRRLLLRVMEEHVVYACNKLGFELVNRRPKPSAEEQIMPAEETKLKQTTPAKNKKFPQETPKKPNEGKQNISAKEKKENPKMPAKDEAGKQKASFEELIPTNDCKKE